MEIVKNKNRSQKYRLWLDDQKKFVYCEYIPTLGWRWNVGDHLLDGLIIEVGENYPQQYTGEKDKNGKEIYEGDRVSGKDLTGETIESIITYNYAAWNLGAWPIYEYEDLEVKGNNYET